MQDKPHITVLMLRMSSINAEDVKELAKLTNLTSLGLQDGNIDAEVVKELAKLTNLTSLDLRGNRINAEDAKALLKSDNFPNLKFLSFGLWGKTYCGNQVDLLQKIESDQAVSKTMIIGSVCGVIAALTVGVGLSILA